MVSVIEGFHCSRTLYAHGAYVGVRWAMALIGKVKQTNGVSLEESGPVETELTGPAAVALE